MVARISAGTIARVVPLRDPTVDEQRGPRPIDARHRARDGAPSPEERSDEARGIGDESVWAFIGDGQRMPCAVFRTRDAAESWVRNHRLSGVLTEYPLDISSYVWAVENGRFTPKKPHQGSAGHIVSFTRGRQHLPFREGVPR